jgi:hypothetical protein
MRNILLTISILMVLQVNSQVNRRHTEIFGEKQVIRIGTNIKILTLGAYDYPSSHLAFTFDWVTKFRNGSEAGITAEFVELNPEYFAGGFQYNKPLIFTDQNGIETLLGAEILFINRSISRVTDSGKSLPNTWGSIKLKAIARYNVSDKFDINATLSGQTRQDENKIWNGNKYSWGVHFKIGYKFN